MKRINLDVLIYSSVVKKLKLTFKNDADTVLEMACTACDYNESRTRLLLASMAADQAQYVYNYYMSLLPVIY